MYHLKKNKSYQIGFFLVLFFSFFSLGFIQKASAGACTYTCVDPTSRGECSNGGTSHGSCDYPHDDQLCCTSPELAGGDTVIPFNNPLTYYTVEGVLGSLLNTLRAIIVTLSLVFIVIGAVLYIISTGDEGRMKTAKSAITASMIGLALGIAAPSFLKQIGDILGWAPTIDCSTLTAGTPEMATCQAAQETLANGKTLSAIALSTLQFLLSVVGVLGIIMLVIGGLTYITAAGNEGRSETGKKIVTYAIIGIAIALASLVIVSQIAGLFA